MRSKDQTEFVYKIMWLPNDDRVIWQLKNNDQIDTSSELYSLLKQFIDLSGWIDAYDKAHTDWLDNDNAAIYDLNGDLVKGMIDAIRNANAFLGDKKILYWYDIDRSVNDVFQWKFCPGTRNKLIDLGVSYHSINRLICADYLLVMPI